MFWPFLVHISCNVSLSPVSTGTGSGSSHPCVGTSVEFGSLVTAASAWWGIRVGNGRLGGVGFVEKCVTDGRVGRDNGLSVRMSLSTYSGVGEFGGANGRSSVVRGPRALSFHRTQAPVCGNGRRTARPRTEVVHRPRSTVRDFRGRGGSFQLPGFHGLFVTEPLNIKCILT